MASREDSGELVPFVPYVCPKCRGHQIRTYATRHPFEEQGRTVRYHHCLPCNLSYRSVEIDADEVPRSLVRLKRPP